MAAATSVMWGLELVTNPRSIRLHVAHELTASTIVTYPPGPAPAPFDAVLDLEAVRSVDLHRYRARCNLAPGFDRAAVVADAATHLAAVWGNATALPAEELPRPISVDRHGERRVAESPQMAAGDPLLEAVFGVDGVAEAIVGDGLILVRLGRFFRWNDVGPEIEVAVRAA